jgi:CheY-like chemotaxis protein
MEEKSILVVDDEVMTAEIISDLLRRLGARTVLAFDEASAFREANEFSLTYK